MSTTKTRVRTGSVVGFATSGGDKGRFLNVTDMESKNLAEDIQDAVVVVASSNSKRTTGGDDFVDGNENNHAKMKKDAVDYAVPKGKGGIAALLRSGADDVDDDDEPSSTAIKAVNTKKSRVRTGSVVGFATSGGDKGRFLNVTDMESKNLAEDIQDAVVVVASSNSKRTTGGDDFVDGNENNHAKMKKDAVDYAVPKGKGGIAALLRGGADDVDDDEEQSSDSSPAKKTRVRAGSAVGFATGGGGDKGRYLCVIDMESKKLADDIEDAVATTTSSKNNGKTDNDFVDGNENNHTKMKKDASSDAAVANKGGLAALLRGGRPAEEAVGGEEEDEEEDAAAVLIQSRYRGHQVREKMRIEQEQKKIEEEKKKGAELKKKVKKSCVRTDSRVGFATVGMQDLNGIGIESVRGSDPEDRVLAVTDIETTTITDDIQDAAVKKHSSKSRVGAGRWGGAKSGGALRGVDDFVDGNENNDNDPSLVKYGREKDAYVEDLRALLKNMGMAPAGYSGGGDDSDDDGHGGGDNDDGAMSVLELKEQSVAEFRDHGGVSIDDVLATVKKSRVRSGSVVGFATIDGMGGGGGGGMTLSGGKAKRLLQVVDMESNAIAQDLQDALASHAGGAEGGGGGGGGTLGRTSSSDPDDDQFMISFIDGNENNHNDMINKYSQKMDAHPGTVDKSILDNDNVGGGGGGGSGRSPTSAVGGPSTGNGNSSGMFVSWSVDLTNTNNDDMMMNPQDRLADLLTHGDVDEDEGETSNLEYVDHTPNSNQQHYQSSSQHQHKPSPSNLKPGNGIIRNSSSSSSINRQRTTNTTSSSSSLAPAPSAASASAAAVTLTKPKYPQKDDIEYYRSTLAQHEDYLDAGVNDHQKFNYYINKTTPNNSNNGSSGSGSSSSSARHALHSSSRSALKNTNNDNNGGALTDSIAPTPASRRQSVSVVTAAGYRTGGGGGSGNINNVDNVSVAHSSGKTNVSRRGSVMNIYGRRTSDPAAAAQPPTASSTSQYQQHQSARNALLSSTRGTHNNSSVMGATSGSSSKYSSIIGSPRARGMSLHDFNGKTQRTASFIMDGSSSPDRKSRDTSMPTPQQSYNN